MCLRRNPPEYVAAQTLLDEAIAVTIPCFDIEKIETYLLGVKDNEIIAKLARIAYETGERDKAIYILEKLAGNIRKRVVESIEKARSLLFVLSYLAIYYDEDNKRREQLAVCDEGMKIGAEYQLCKNLPTFAFNKACALYVLDGDKDKIKNLLYQAYYGSLLHGDNYRAGIICKLAETRFGVGIKTFG